MKLVRFEFDGHVGLGAIRHDGVVDLGHVTECADDMQAMIAGWPQYRHTVANAIVSLPSAVPLAQVRLLAPIERPGKIMAIGLNYADHIAESRLPAPAHQFWFAKATTSINGPYDAIQLPKVSAALDYEAELVAVVGKRGRHIPAARASEHLFGFCAGNDVSVRDWQKHTSQFVVGKSFDTHAPVGPWIVTCDEIGDPHELGIRCLVNDELRQSSNTRHLVFDIYEQVAYLSQAMTLEPGDLIFTGTPGGVGSAMKPPRFLREGDRVRVEIDHIGAIEATVAMEAA